MIEFYSVPYPEYDVPYPEYDGTLPSSWLTYKSVTPKEVESVIACLEKWFLAIEKGLNWLPNMDEDLPTMEEADKLIGIVDSFIENEVTADPSYWNSQGLDSRGKPMDMPAEFSRLKGAMRIAFAQSLKLALREEKTA